MKIEPLLRKGYFPKELPPPFTTKYFSENFYSIDKSWNDTKSRLGRTNPKLLEKYEKKNQSVYYIHFLKEISQEEILKFLILFTIQFYVKLSVIIGMKSTLFVRNQ
jgi:hypothetical protein